MSLDSDLRTFPSMRGRLSFTADEKKRMAAAEERMRAAAAARCKVYTKAEIKALQRERSRD